MISLIYIGVDELDFLKSLRTRFFAKSYADGVLKCIRIASREKEIDEKLLKELRKKYTQRRVIKIDVTDEILEFEKKFEFVRKRKQRTIAIRYAIEVAKKLRGDVW